MGNPQTKDFNGWLEKNRELIASFPHDFLLNIDETAHFWHADDAKTFVPQRNQPEGSQAGNFPRSIKNFL